MRKRRYPLRIQAAELLKKILIKSGTDSINQTLHEAVIRKAPVLVFQ